MPAKKLKSILRIVGVVVLLWTVAGFICSQNSPWRGVDEKVVEKIAEEHGRAARKPFINTDQGDLLLFVFLLAGTAGGFVIGYNFRKLFGEKKNGQEKQ